MLNDTFAWGVISVLQIYSLATQCSQAFTFRTHPSELLSPASRQTFYPLHAYAITYRSILFADSLCQLLITVCFLTTLHKSVWI